MHAWMIRRSLPVNRSFVIIGVVVTVMLSSLSMASTAAAASVPLTKNAAKAAAGWLARELTDEERIEEFFDGAPGDFPELTAQAVLDFDAAGVAQRYAENATEYLASPSVSIGFLSGEQGVGSVEAHAMILLVAEAQGVDPTSFFGGVDVPGELLSMLNPSGVFTDGGNDVSVAAKAIIALSRYSGAPASAVNALLAAQCPDGGFPETVESNPTIPGPCDSFLLTTPDAIEALQAAGGHQDAVDRALDWLQTQQGTDGGFTFQGDDSMTGTAALVLLAGDRKPAAREAIAFLKAAQAGCASSVIDRGAISSGGPGGGVVSGTNFDADTTIRATIAAIPALARSDISDVSAADARRKAPELRCDGTTSG
jgi:hypothetical protein